MDATISVICYKSKILSNGEHPLMLRIAQNGKSKYKSLNISVAAKHWDFNKNTPKPNCPNKELINKIILKTKLEYQQKVLEKKANAEEFTPSSLIHEQKEEIKAMTVDDFYKQLIKELKEKGRIGNSNAYLSSYDNLKNFNKGKMLNYTCNQLADSMRSISWLRKNSITMIYEERIVLEIIFIFELLVLSSARILDLWKKTDLILILKGIEF